MWAPLLPSDTAFQRTIYACSNGTQALHELFPGLPVKWSAIIPNLHYFELSEPLPSGWYGYTLTDRYQDSINYFRSYSDADAVFKSAERSCLIDCGPDYQRLLKPSFSAFQTIKYETSREILNQDLTRGWYLLNTASADDLPLNVNEDHIYAPAKFIYILGHTEPQAR